MIEQIDVTTKRAKRPQLKPRCKPKAAPESPTVIEQALADAGNSDQEALTFLRVCAPDALDAQAEDVQDLLADALDWWIEPE